MKILVTGAGGQLGFDVVKQLQARHIECQGVDFTDFDITDAQATEAYIKSYRPDIMIHCSAYTAVDKAEDEPEKCWAVNVDGTENIAKVCREIDAKMIYISTDYVFPGTGEHFYKVDDATGPLSAYGKTKLAGEEAVKKWLGKYYIVRISWVFGKNGNNFVKTMLRLGSQRDSLGVVADQWGGPTYAGDIAAALLTMAEQAVQPGFAHWGVYHFAGEPHVSWHEFATTIFAAGVAQGLLVQSPLVNPIATADYPTPAKRPTNSRLDCSRIHAVFGIMPSDWQAALSDLSPYMPA